MDDGRRLTSAAQAAFLLEQLDAPIEGCNKP